MRWITENFGYLQSITRAGGIKLASYLVSGCRLAQQKIKSKPRIKMAWDSPLMNGMYIMAGLLVGILITWLAIWLFFFKGYDKKQQRVYDPSGERAARIRKQRYAAKRLVPYMILCLLGVATFAFSIYKGLPLLAATEKNTLPDTTISMSVYTPASSAYTGVSPEPVADSIQVDSLATGLKTEATIKTDTIKNIPVPKPLPPVAEQVKPVTATPIVTVPPKSNFIKYTLKRQLMPNPKLKDIFYIRNGTVAFNVVVNNSGKVTWNELNNSKSNTSDNTLISYANKLMQEVRFTGAQKIDSGTVYFNFGNNPE